MRRVPAPIDDTSHDGAATPPAAPGSGLVNTTVSAALSEVIGYPATTGAASAAGTPGTSSHDMPDAPNARASDPTSPNRNASPAYSRTTVSARAAASIIRLTARSGSPPRLEPPPRTVTTS